jgi:predicted DNA-binding transcriptional regulator
MSSAELRADLEKTKVLRGTTLEIYRFMVKSGKPVGVREIQRALNLSSASVATYHLSKLEEAGFIKREQGNYALNKIILKDNVRFGHMLVPRFFFYILFTALILTIELVFFNELASNRGFFIYTIATSIIMLIFSYETIKKWLENSI